MAEVPHFAIPLRRVGATGTLAEVEQDSEADVDACIEGIMRTPVGWRVDLPEFGTPDPAHEQGGPNLQEVEDAVALWEDRADVRVLRESGRLAELAAGLDRLTVVASQRD